MDEINNRIEDTICKCQKLKRRARILHRMPLGLQRAQSCQILSCVRVHVVVVCEEVIHLATITSDGPKKSKNWYIGVIRRKTARRMQPLAWLVNRNEISSMMPLQKCMRWKRTERSLPKRRRFLLMWRSRWRIWRDEHSRILSWIYSFMTLTKVWMALKTSWTCLLGMTAKWDTHRIPLVLTKVVLAKTVALLLKTLLRSTPTIMIRAILIPIELKTQMTMTLDLIVLKTQMNTILILQGALIPTTAIARHWRGKQMKKSIRVCLGSS